MVRSCILVIALFSYVTADTYAPAASYGPPLVDAVPPLPYAAAYPVGESVEGPYLKQLGGPEGFNIQSGFEGYLIPSVAGKLAGLPLKGLGTVVGSGIGLGLGYLKSLHPLKKFFFKVLPKVALAVAGVLALFVVGGVFSTAICTLTPICTVSYHGLLPFGFTRETMRAYLTEDNLAYATTFVTDAIDKFKGMYEDADPAVDKNEVK